MTRARARCTASLAESKKEHGKAAAEHGLGLFLFVMHTNKALRNEHIVKNAAVLVFEIKNQDKA